MCAHVSIRTYHSVYVYTQHIQILRGCRIRDVRVYISFG